MPQDYLEWAASNISGNIGEKIKTYLLKKRRENMTEKNPIGPSGKVKVKESKAGNKYFSGWFGIDDKRYFLNITKAKEDYSVWVDEMPPRENEKKDEKVPI